MNYQQKYKCTKLTISRNLKKNLGEIKYKEINKNKSKILKKIKNLKR